MTSPEPATRIQHARVFSATPRPVLWWGVQALLIVLLVSWRAISLDADPRADFIPQDIGYHIDEGYKTLSPRNLAIFGETHWNEADEYGGWMRRSPVTQWPYYLSFRALGVERESARLVNILFFAAFLVAATIFLNRRGSSALAVAGIVLLGSDMALFNFSRVGVFEIAVCFFVYAGVFIASSLSPVRRFAPLAVVLASGMIAAAGVKASALLYVAPPLVLLLLIEMFESRASTRTKTIVMATATALGLALLYMTADIWQDRVDFGAAFESPSSTLLFHPVYMLSPLAYGLACLATLDIYLRLGLEEFRRNRFLLITASMAVFIPVILAAFRYNPPRYYLTVVPAALLVLVEWLRLYKPKLRGSVYRLSPVRLGVAGLVLLPLTASLAGFAGTHVVGLLPFIPQGEDPGVDPVMLIRLYPIILVAGATLAAILLNRRRLHTVVVPGLVLGIFAQVAFSLRSDIIVVREPTYITDYVQVRLSRVVADGESIGGDWAPYFALGTEIPALYMTKTMNTENIEAVRPTYFLNSNTVWDRRTLAGLKARPGIGLGRPIPLGTLFGREIELHRVLYTPEGGLPEIIPDD